MRQAKESISYQLSVLALKVGVLLGLLALPLGSLVADAEGEVDWSCKTKKCTTDTSCTGATFLVNPTNPCKITCRSGGKDVGWADCSKTEEEEDPPLPE